MLKQGYDYSLEVMTDLFSHDVNQGCAPADRLLVTNDAQKVLIDGSNLTILDGRHQYATVEILDKEGEHL